MGEELAEGGEMVRNNALRVLIAEDHDIVRRCLCLAIARRAEFQVVGEAATAAQAKEMAADLRPDVVVVDVALPDETGVETARAIRSRNPEVRVLILTSHGDDRAVISSIMAGALGYLAKEIRSQEIVEAVRRAGQGQSLLDRSIAVQVLARVLRGMAEAEASRLTSLEQQIVDSVARGNTDREIAELLQLSEGQVARHVGAILGKLELLCRSQAAAYLAGRRAQRSVN
jgi:DNA-binding NarL/FixJ family response regulator